MVDMAEMIVWLTGLLAAGARLFDNSVAQIISENAEQWKSVRGAITLLY